MPVDQLLRAISRDHRLRVLAAVTTDLVREACARHEIGGAEALVLGRALTAGCLLSTLTKDEEERVRVEFRGEGPLGRVHVDSRSTGHVRGFIGRAENSLPQRHPPFERGRHRLAGLVGDGVVVITRDIGLENPYQGIVPITSGEIDEDLEHYLGHSEQMPSALGCEVILDAHGGVLRAAGVLTQTFPGVTPHEIGELRRSLFTGSLADLLRSPRTAEELIGFALGGAEYDALAASPLAFRCSCDPSRARAILSTLGADDLDALAEEPGDAEVRCAHCGARYGLSGPEIHALADEIRRERS